ncbi:MAG: LPXTG cell wall anchor domain-containing protein, partial [bacterium]|nr:LPXTG cell wall anchor domain-containing protein [bacterium]
GAELPSTGGMGTTIFYVLGSILVLAAVVLLVTKKRMGEKN